MRFFSLSNDLSRTAHDEADVDYVQLAGLLATVGWPEERIVGHALYAPSGEGRAEVAFAIAREYQGRGLATMLLGQLAEAAAAHGIHTFEAVVLTENRRMLDVFRESGFPVQTQLRRGTRSKSTFPTSLTPQRWRALSSAKSWPRRARCGAAVPAVGGGDRRVRAGAARSATRSLRNLLAAGFPGPIYPINPAGGTIQSLPAFAGRRGGARSGRPGDHRGARDAGRWQCAEQCGRKGCTRWSC